MSNYNSGRRERRTVNGKMASLAPAEAGGFPFAFPFLLLAFPISFPFFSLSTLSLSSLLSLFCLNLPFGWKVK